MEIGGIVMIVFLLVFYLVLFAASIALYVLNGIGLMKMAKSCGLARGWMAFVPIANVYLMGQLAEQNPTAGKKSLPWRHIVLVGYILTLVLNLVMLVWMVVEMVGIQAETGDFTDFDVMGLYGSLIGIMLPLSIVSTAVSVVLYIIYWKIFALFAPDLAVVFLVLTILFNIQPILFFILRNRTPVNRPGPSNEGWV